MCVARVYIEMSIEGVVHSWVTDEVDEVSRLVFLYFRSFGALCVISLCGAGIPLPSCIRHRSTPLAHFSGEWFQAITQYFKLNSIRSFVSALFASFTPPNVMVVDFRWLRQSSVASTVCEVNWKGLKTIRCALRKLMMNFETMTALRMMVKSVQSLRCETRFLCTCVYHDFFRLQHTYLRHWLVNGFRRSSADATVWDSSWRYS